MSNTDFEEEFPVVKVINQFDRILEIIIEIAESGQLNDDEDRTLECVVEVLQDLYGSFGSRKASELAEPSIGNPLVGIRKTRVH